MTSTAVDTSKRSSPPPLREAGTGPRGRTGPWTRRAPLLPALVFLVVVTQLPFVATLVISFMDWNALFPDDRGFAGSGNYVTAFTDEALRSSIITTVVLTAVVVIVSLVLGLGLALLPLELAEGLGHVQRRREGRHRRRRWWWRWAGRLDDRGPFDGPGGPRPRQGVEHLPLLPA